jgi:hypothetical protein
MIKVKKTVRRMLGMPAPAVLPAPQLAAVIERDRDAWRAALASAQGGPRVLVATSIGGYAPGTTLESLLAAALTLRGAEVHVLLCDHALAACLHASEEALADAPAFAREGPQRELCRSCEAAGHRGYDALGLPIHYYGDLVSAEQLGRNADLAAATAVDDIVAYEDDGIAVGEHAMAGALRFFARGTLPSGGLAEPVLRRYFSAALLATAATSRLMEEVPFEAAVFHHGIYVPQGLIGEVARRRGVRVANWHVAYRKRSFIFSHRESYHHTLPTEPAGNWEGLVLTPAMEDELMGYLKSRWRGTRDWIGFHEEPREEVEAIARELKIDFSRPTIGMLTNVMWDARLHYRTNAFPDMLDWAVRTVDYFRRRPDLQLLIRIHPAEVRGTLPSRQPLEAELRKAFPQLPSNVFLIPAQSRISTYAAMSQCDSAIVYGTKMGVELTSLGIPVIVAGEAWIKNKGLTLDARSPEEYFALLDRLPLGRRMDAAQLARARRYAYHFFFRRMIPLEQFEPEGASEPRLRIASLDELRPGASRGLDVICDGILEGREFIYPAEVAGAFE